MCGDAAGRECDRSDVDAAFAKAAGIRFFTPEEMFDSSSTKHPILDHLAATPRHESLEPERRPPVMRDGHNTNRPRAAFRSYPDDKKDSTLDKTELGYTAATPPRAGANSS